MSSDPGIICVPHCRTKIFCFQIPEMCPTCRLALDDDGGHHRQMPFRLPCPFVRAAEHPCAIVLRPTIGDFLKDYNNCKDLHIAVTTSEGTIVEFDGKGLQRTSKSDPGWWQSLLVANVPEPWHDLWDSVLMQICRQPNWTVDDYHEDAHNCYTFVLAFLQSLGYNELSTLARNKTDFCERFIVPKTTNAGKYISLYRKLTDNGIYVEGEHG